MVDSPLFYDPNLDGFTVYPNPSFDLSMPLDYEIASSPSLFILNYVLRFSNHEMDILQKIYENIDSCIK